MAIASSGTPMWRGHVDTCRRANRREDNCKIGMRGAINRLDLVQRGELMIRYKKPAWIFASCLSLIAGFVDAVAFLKLGGFFVSFMSGNSTRLGVGLAESTSAALLSGALIALFITGVVLGSFFAGFSSNNRQFFSLTIVATLLAAAACAATFRQDSAAICAMALAMGAENTVFERDDEVTIGLTYMTGTLVKAGQRIAAALRGRNVWAWVPYILLWTSLVGGAALGAIVYPVLGLNSMWFPAIGAAALALLVFRSSHLVQLQP